MAETQKATVVFGVLNETSQDETRVALTPDIVTRLKKAGVSCLVQSGAGIAAQYTDDDYAKAGAEVVAADDVIARADVLGFVDRPSAETVARLKAGTWVIGMPMPRMWTPSRRPVLSVSRWRSCLASSAPRSPWTR